MDAKLQELCRQAHEDRIRVGMLDTDTKNRTLELAADALMAHEQEILEANAIDMERGRERNMPQGLLDRLKLDHDRLLGMADGLRQVAKLEDPIGEVMSMRKRPNGLIIGKVRVAIGVVGIIFEARPNVTSDAFGLCFKSGNCAILKGGSDAIHSNIAIVSAMQEALRRMNIPKGALSLIESTDRETTNAFMKMKDYVDLLIPRGGRGLIQSVVNNATIPVIETGTGNCHVYVDQFADQEMAVNIIKNAKTQGAKAVKEISANVRFALTGTPVENRLSELWSIFDFLMPGFLYSYRKFRERYELPIVKNQDPEALTALRRMTGPFVLRRLKKDVLRELPGKEERIVYSAASGRQQKLYTASALKLKEALAGGAWSGNGKLEVLSQLMRLRQICCDPALCFEDYTGESAKLETCVSLIASASAAGHKILLFSQFASMLERIRERLLQEGISSHLLVGATPKEERSRMVQAFASDEVPVFLISLKAGGTGLNLTAADIVIHYDPWWNVAAQNQATDRAYRIGQEKPVTVYKLILKDTIEENLLKLQNAKLALAAQVVSEGMVSLGDLSQNELMELFEQNP